MHVNAINAAADWHLLRVDEVEQSYQTGPQGLTNSEAALRLAEYGPNKLEEFRKKSPLLMLLSQLADFMILVLLAAAAFNFKRAMRNYSASFLSFIKNAVFCLLSQVWGQVQSYPAYR